MICCMIIQHTQYNKYCHYAAFAHDQIEVQAPMPPPATPWRARNAGKGAWCRLKPTRRAGPSWRPAPSPEADLARRGHSENGSQSTLSRWRGRSGPELPRAGPMVAFFKTVCPLPLPSLIWRAVGGLRPPQPHFLVAGAWLASRDFISESCIWKSSPSTVGI